MSYSKFISFAALTGILLTSCNGGTEETKTTGTTAEHKTVSAPAFNEDSAYAYVSRQVDFGARVPGSEAQVKCAQWMQAMLKKVCDTVYRQEVNVTAGNGKQLRCINLIGAINPGATKRILFVTHWDSRPWADQDKKDTDQPVMAADDGASGVGVLLEMARVLKADKLSPSIGIDILLTDAEDYGRSEWGENSYCLGTQYWAHNPHVPGYRADYGILLDMVGAKGAQFPMEHFSSMTAGDVQHKVWQAASNAGYSSYFIFVPGAEITDDHVPVNKITEIKIVDVINMTQDLENPFAPHWHTHADVMSIIDKNTLKAVGQTMLQTIYEQLAANGGSTI